MTEWVLPETFRFDGRSIRYGVTGKGPSVVLVHGTPWSSFNLRHLIKRLSLSYTVYYYDMAGYGQSDKSPGDVSLGIQNRILDQLIRHWELTSPAIIGHDFGGTTVLRTHLLNGLDFSKIVLIDPVAISPWGSPFFQHVNAHESAFAGVPDYIHEAIVRAYVKTAAFKPLAESTLDMIVRPWTETGGKAAFYRQIAQADSRFTDDVEPKYRTISRPVLILWGKEDTWIPVEKGRILHRMIPDALFETVSDAGHLVIEEQPEQLVGRILLFLSD